MRETYFRRLDVLGRIVLPREVRQELRLRDKDELKIRVENGIVILEPWESKNRTSLKVHLSPLKTGTKKPHG